jgi:hypothetical protein
MISLTDDLKKSYDRILAARERLLSLRGERVAQLFRLQSYLRAQLDDFFTNVDPVTGARLAELSSEGNKAYGDVAMTLEMFDGSMMKIGVDGKGRLSHEASPDVFAGIGEIVELRVNPETGSAEFSYIPSDGASGQARQGDFGAVVEFLVEHTMTAIEAQIATPVQAFEPQSAPQSVPRPEPVIDNVRQIESLRSIDRSIEIVPPPEPVRAFEPARALEPARAFEPARGFEDSFAYEPIRSYEPVRTLEPSRQDPIPVKPRALSFSVR